MSDLPSREIVELIKGQARLEVKLDDFLKTQSAHSAEMQTVKKDIREIQDGRRTEKAYIAGALAVFPFVSTIIWTYLRERFGL